MHQEFKDFLAVWQKIMKAKGGISLPARKDITVRDFAEWLPSMLITSWDFDVPEREVAYVGTLIDDLFLRDVKSTSLTEYFPDPEELEQQVGAIKHVVSELVGIVGDAFISINHEKKVSYSFVNLPLAPENGMPITVSLFLVDDIEALSDDDREMISKNPVVTISQTEFFPLFDDE